MAPPEFSNSDRHGDYHEYLEAHNFKDNRRLGANVDRLSAWLEFLLHPETHDYDREVYGPFERTGGTWVWREQPERMYNYATGDGEEFEYRSVLHEYRYSEFLDPLVAVSTQQVEHGSNLLALATAAVNNIYWVGQKFTHEVAKFPSEWKSPAAEQAKAFVSRLESVATQMNLVVGELKDLLPKYGLLIRATREDLNKAVGGVVANFEDKFATKPDGSLSFDVIGLVVSTLAAGAITYMTGGAGAVIGEAMVTLAWTKTIDTAVEDLFTEEKQENIGKIEGHWWKDIAKSYLNAVDGILRDAAAGMNQLNTKMAELAQNFENAVPAFEDTLPQVEQAPQ